MTHWFLECCYLHRIFWRYSEFYCPKLSAQTFQSSPTHQASLPPAYLYRQEELWVSPGLTAFLCILLTRLFTFKMFFFTKCALTPRVNPELWSSVKEHSWVRLSMFLTRKCELSTSSSGHLLLLELSAISLCSTALTKLDRCNMMFLSLLLAVPNKTVRLNVSLLIS